MRASITQSEFLKAPQVLVTFPEIYKANGSFVSIAQYPRGFEPDDDEFGMLVKNGEIEFRLFSVGDIS